MTLQQILFFYLTYLHLHFLDIIYLYLNSIFTVLPICCTITPNLISLLILTYQVSKIYKYDTNISMSVDSGNPNSDY